jgi:hypothetical protein
MLSGFKGKFPEMRDMIQVLAGLAYIKLNSRILIEKPLPVNSGQKYSIKNEFSEFTSMEN